MFRVAKQSIENKWFVPDHVSNSPLFQRNARHALFPAQTNACLPQPRASWR